MPWKLEPLWCFVGRGLKGEVGQRTSPGHKRRQGPLLFFSMVRPSVPNITITPTLERGTQFITVNKSKTEPHTAWFKLGLWAGEMLSC